MATALPLGPFWAVLAERFSRKAIIVRSQLLLAAATLVAAFAPDLAWLVAARALMGLSFGTGGVIVATQAMLTPSRYVGRAIAAVQTAQPIAGSIGPPLGALIIPQLGLQGLFLLDGVLLLVATIAMALLLPEPSGGLKPKSIMGRVREVLVLGATDPPIRWSFLNQALARGSIATIDSYLPVRIAQVASDPASAIGFILGAYGAATTLAAWALSRIVGRVDELKLYWRAMLLGTVLAVAISLAPWLWLVATFAILRSVPTAFSRPLLFMHLARVVPPVQQTGIFGLLPTAGNFGGLVLPLIASAFAPLGLGAALAVAALGHAVSTAAGIRLHRLR
jgi:predicted MFS family arabinose efflux permease